jgi:protein-tyrosine phosphatase
MIDLHSHILPNFDDGARNLADALLIAEFAIEDGITTMAATPHGLSDFNPRYSVQLLRERLAELQAALTAADLALNVIPGTELFCNDALPAQLAAGEQLCYGDSHTVLLEFPSSTVRLTIERMLFALQSAGYRVLIAHPERLRIVQDDPNVLIPLIERGALMQLTANALTGNQGGSLQRTAETLVRHQMIHVIASDTHGPHLRRMPGLSKAARRAAGLLGEVAAIRLTQATPLALLNDAPLKLPPPIPFQRRRFW